MTRDCGTRDCGTGKAPKGIPEIVFVRPDGTLAENAVYGGCYDHEGNEMFFEILGMPKVTAPRLTVDGKEPYKRLLIRRVYPCIPDPEGAEHQ